MRLLDRAAEGLADLLLLLLAVYSLSFLTVFSFSLTFDPWLLAAGLGAFCLTAWVFFSFRRSRLWLAGLTAAALALALSRLPLEPLSQSVRTALFLITRSYARAYDWFPGVFSGPEEGDCTLFLLALGLLLAVYFGWALIGMRRRPIWALAGSVLLFAPEAAIHGYPQPLCLAGLAAFWAVLLLTASLRRGGVRGEAGRLALAALPVTAGLLVLGLAVIQPGRYQPNARLHALADQAAGLWDEHVVPLFVPQETETPSPAPAETDGMDEAEAPPAEATETPERADPALPWFSSGMAGGGTELDLTGLGPLVQSPATMLRVYADVSGTIYLRGASMGDYAGDRWEPAEDYPGTGGLDAASSPVTQSPLSYAAAAAEAAGGTVRQMELASGADDARLYAPYYVQGGGTDSRSDVLLTWPDGVRDYVIYAGGLSALSVPEALAEEEAAYRTYVHSVYTQLPEDTRTALLALAGEAGLEAGSARLIDAVAQYVQNAAVYRTQVQAYPAGTDCAVYFLTEGKEGYCVHFATAAAALYRALDVPARLVSGYVFSAEAGTWTDVSGKRAHAWVEVYQDGAGWLPVEVTGSSGTEEDPAAPAETPEPGSEAPSAETQPAPELSVGLAGPGGSGGGAAPALLWVLLALAGLAALIPLRRRAVLRLRARRLAGPDRGRAAVVLERCGRKLERWGAPRCGEAEALAQQACFSCRPVTGEALAAARAEVERRAAELDRALPRWKRLWLRYGLCLW